MKQGNNLTCVLRFFYFLRPPPPPNFTRYHLITHTNTATCNLASIQGQDTLFATVKWSIKLQPCFLCNAKAFTLFKVIQANNRNNELELETNGSGRWVQKNTGELTSFGLDFLGIKEKVACKTADIPRRQHWFPREVTFEERAQKFHSDDVSQPRSP